ncbi:MAG: hypothetical protein ABJB12_13255 [Pseudomonadota bacterium]
MPSPFTGETAAPASPATPPLPSAAPPPAQSTLPLPPPPPPPPDAASAPAVAGPPVSAPPGAMPPGAPGSDLPAPPRQARGSFLHDGFYLRMGLGLAYSGALVSSDSKSLGDYSFAGGGVAFDLWLGGTPTPGLALGAALSGVGLNSSSRRASDQSISGAVSGSTGLLGFFADVFPDPERGFHFGGALGVASGLAKPKDSGMTYEGGGIGLEAWTGYDFWVGQQWSLGGAVRFIGTVTRQDTDTVKYETSMGGMSLSFTALYH